jgi:hypothetical protein
MPVSLLALCVAGLLSGAKKYRDALAAMTEAQQSFAASLAEFGAGSDEESLLLGELAGQQQLAGQGLQRIAICNCLQRSQMTMQNACRAGSLQNAGLCKAHGRVELLAEEPAVASGMLGGYGSRAGMVQAAYPTYMAI